VLVRIPSKREPEDLVGEKKYKSITHNVAGNRRKKENRVYKRGTERSRTQFKVWPERTGLGGGLPVRRKGEIGVIRPKCGGLSHAGRERLGLCDDSEGLSYLCGKQEGAGKERPGIRYIPS